MIAMDNSSSYFHHLFCKRRYPVFVHHADLKMCVVCIVGAGISGLRCAEVLTQQGLKVTILEGRNRIGGRVS